MHALHVCHSCAPLVNATHGPQKEFPATGGKSRGAPGKEAELSVEQQLAMQSSAIKYLLAEARS
eukprot:scaffold263399_cov19-Tisochrysis_lutea.AAC.1